MMVSNIQRLWNNVLVALPLKDGKQGHWRVVLGWAPYYIGNMAGSEVTINEKVIKGPGKAITGEKLFEFSQGIDAQ